MFKQTNTIRDWAKYYYPAGKFSFLRYFISHIGVSLLLLIPVFIDAYNEGFNVVQDIIPTHIILVFLLVPFFSISGLLIVAKLADKYNFNEQMSIIILLLIFTALALFYLNFQKPIFDWKIFFISIIVVSLLVFLGVYVRDRMEYIFKFFFISLFYVRKVS